MNSVQAVTQGQLKTNLPDFRSGDKVKVYVKIKEGEKERVQIFEGTVIARRGGGMGESFTVRKISGNVGVERVFPLHTPSIDRIEVVMRGRVRRAKLYYLRGRVGKATRVAELKSAVKPAAPAAAK